ncbi:MAG: pyridoxamine 5'-phosphate oxidase family protein [Elstera sp.]
MLPAFYNDLALTETEAWALLARGAVDRKSPYHLMQLASLAQSGSGEVEPRVRTVVLRGVERAEKRLRFHTDARSPKVAELAACPRVQALFYDPGHKIQLRLTARAAPASESVRTEAWEKTGRLGRVCYAVTAAPSAPQLGPAADFAAEADPTVFQPMILTVTALDWLYLASEGHRRAAFSYGPTGDLTAATWLVP